MTRTLLLLTIVVSVTTGVGCKKSASPEAPASPTSSGKSLNVSSPQAISTATNRAQPDPSFAQGDVGISAEQFSVDFGSLGKGRKLVTVPAVSRDDEGFLSSWPAHLALETEPFDFRIMSIERYTKIFPDDKRISNLRAVLAAGVPAVKIEGFPRVVPETQQPPFPIEELPYSLKEEWCGYNMLVRQDMVQGEGWHGLKWIGGFGGDEDYPSCGLKFVFLAISDNGSYLIVMRANVSHPEQKALLPHRKINGTPPNTWESSDPKEETAQRIELEKALAAAKPDSFTPNLDQLDAVIRSLKFLH